VGAPVSLLGNARAFARDYARDQMPPGYLWDVLDFVPSIIDANLTNRGGWRWGSVAATGDIEVGILANFSGSDQLLVQTIDGRVLQLNEDGGVPPGSNPEANTWTDRGGTFRAAQNPVQLGQSVIHFDAAGLNVPQLWRDASVVSAYAGMAKPRYGTVWKGSLISGGGQGVGATDESDVIRFSVAGQDLTTAGSFDVNSFLRTSGRITGLQALRSMTLIFHPSSIERLRGGPFPNTAAGEEGLGMILDNFQDRVGCTHPKTISTWNDSVIFADEHGVHMTDGSVLRTLTTQGGISHYWRVLYDHAYSISATTFLDYYIVTTQHPITRPPIPDHGAPEPVPLLFEARDPSVRPPVPPLPPDLPDVRPPVPEPAPGGLYNTTLICDLNRKQWFRFSNVDAYSYISGGGTAAMERVWAGISGSHRLARIGPCFYPDDGGEQVDGNLVRVAPRFETPWYRLGLEGRKRVRFAYLSYACRCFSPVIEPLRIGYILSPGDTNYSQAGVLPLTSGYRRVRLPVNKYPYGIAFFVETIEPIGGLHVYDLAVEAQATERSRV
jgi:hypothetical protein